MKKIALFRLGILLTMVVLLVIVGNAKALSQPTVKLPIKENKIPETHSPMIPLPVIIEPPIETETELSPQTTIENVEISNVFCNGDSSEEPDEHTLLLVHFDGDYTGAQGEPANFSGTTFVDGCFGQGVLIDDGDTLTYTTSGNLDGTMGLIDFWVQPNWQGDDEQMHIFFETGSDAYGGIQIGKDGIGTLHFVMWNLTDHADVVYNIEDWQAGEWHHVIASWQEYKMVLFVDGQRSEIFSTISDLDDIGTSLYIGSSPNLGWWADAVMDELHIRDLPIQDINLPLVFLGEREMKMP